MPKSVAEHLRDIALKLQQDIGYPFPEDGRVSSDEQGMKIYAYGIAIGSIYKAISEYEERINYGSTPDKRDSGKPKI